MITTETVTPVTAMTVAATTERLTAGTVTTGGTVPGVATTTGAATTISAALCEDTLAEDALADLLTCASLLGGVSAPPPADPALCTLLRFATAAEELAELRRDAASGLALDVPGRLLAEEFGRGGIVRFEELDFPAALTHEPTRRFLRETGLPEDGRLFHLDMDVPLPTLTAYYEAERPGGRLPARADHLIRLGHPAEDHSVVVDGATGEVHIWSEREAILHPLSRDVSTLAFTLWLLNGS
jgi:hypothetical protein